MAVVCPTGKARYESRRQRKHAGSRQKLERSVYGCTVCHGFHVSSQKQDRR